MSLIAGIPIICSGSVDKEIGMSHQNNHLRGYSIELPIVSGIFEAKKASFSPGEGWCCERSVE
jgi:hypothetical protein